MVMFAKALVVRLIICPASGLWDDVIHHYCCCHAVFLLAIYAQRMLLQPMLPSLLPRPAIPTLYSLSSLRVIPFLFLLGVGLTESLAGQLGAAWVGAGLLWSPRGHSIQPFNLSASLSLAACDCFIHARKAATGSLGISERLSSNPVK